ncbi:hypothetical protein V6259_13045 [Marinomonas sp. TI.3.20]|uniref:hypothetical protein n=1 Tax=Marinomonas sp. TI.3.20 TaxID=3121296 RepID=UPI00311FC675
MIGLLSKFTPRRISEFDQDKFIHGVESQKLKPLGQNESSEGFESPDGAAGELYLKGGQVAIMAKFVLLTHDYDKHKVKSIVQQLLSKVDDKEEKGLAKKLKEQAEERLRKEGKTFTKEAVIHLVIYKSRGEKYLYVDADYNSDLYETVTNLFPIIGIEGVEKDEVVEFDDVNPLFSNAYTEILKDSSLLDDFKVVSPIKMDDTVKIDIGGDCVLVEADNDGDSKEKATLVDFDLIDRDDVKIHLDRKRATVCQFKFSLNDIQFKFCHSEKHVFSGCKLHKTTGAKVDVGDPNDQLILSAYAMRAMHLASQSMIDLV